MSFTVTLANAGPGPAQRVTVRDRLPTGYTYVSHSASRGTYAPSTGLWNNVPVAAHANAQLVIVATVKPSGTRLDIAEVMASTSADPDSTPGNGNTTEDDYARVTTMPRPPNVAPVITGQRPLAVAEEQPLMIVLGDLTVVDPDNPYPLGFTLSVFPGAHYAITGVNQITPEADYNGTLAVPVVVNDGTADSAPFSAQVSVTPTNDAPVIVGQAPLASARERRSRSASTT